jgi:hypothetical protein
MLLNIDIEAKDGGYLIDQDGSKVNSITLDTLESELIITYGKDTP